MSSTLVVGGGLVYAYDGRGCTSWGLLSPGGFNRARLALPEASDEWDDEE